MCSPGHEHAHPHAALGGVHERLGERRARHEVGGGEVERLARRRDREVVERLDVGVADAGARAHELHRAAVLPALELGRVAVADQHLAGRLEPVLGERAEQPAHDRAAHAHVGVAPVVGVLGVAGPLLRDPDAAGQPDAAVGDEDLAVRAVGEPPPRVGLRRAEARDADAAVDHPLEHVGLHLHAAHRVDDHVALDPGGRALAQRVGDLVGDVAAPVGVGEHADRLLAPGGSSPGSRGRCGRR